MNFILQPWQLFLLILAGWINRHQKNVIDYLKTENEALEDSSTKNGFCSPTISAAIWPSSQAD
jgi:hypothetical protein